MADISDVTSALVSLIAQIIYPIGTGQSSAVTNQVRIYTGWPQSDQLNKDLLAGNCHISIFPSQSERNTTRYLRQWQQLPIIAPTVTLTVNNNQVTVGGIVQVCNVSLLLGNTSYAYAVQATDTLTSIATAFAALISGASNTGPVITLPSSSNVKAARVGIIAGTMFREIRRQERLIMICIWAPTPTLRDAIAKVIDAYLVDTTFITMPDQSAAHVNYKNSPVIDDRQKAALYRRDLNYLIEYATTETTTATQVTQINTNISKVLDDPVTSTSVSIATFTQNS